MKRIFIILLAMTAYVCSSAQLSTNELPISFDPKIKSVITSKRSKKPITMPTLNMAKIVKEDEEDEEYDMPPRFGYPHKVNYDLNNSGTWFELPNGDKLWQLEVICPDALSVNFCYDKFWVPEGGKFFVFSKDGKHTIGAFTSKNNKGDRGNIRGFATGLVYGDDVILEYYQPKDVTIDAIISIEYVVHGYRYVNFGEKSFGGAGNCMVNVNCEEGQDWQIEKKAVARIIIEGMYYCSGSLINTTSFNERPFFLTANHCISGIGKDAVNNSNLDYTFLYWNYEMPGCYNNNIEPTIISTSGATVVANNSYSDFALLRLSEDPQYLSNFTPYYLGWDHSGDCGNPGVCIHHPKGDVKKISTVDGLPISSNWYGTDADSHWKVYWTSTLNGHGTTEGGSSGSPLLTAAHKVIGQLHGGDSDCGDSILAPDWYGKFDVSWTGNGNTSTYRRLNCWLDSLNTGEQSIGGLLVVSQTYTISTPQQLYGDVCINNGGHLTIQSDMEIMGNGRITIENGGTLIVDGCTLSNVDIVMKSGSSLQIINGGIIETLNGFIAPVGVSVTINNGQIL